jgi:hypothetical protein
MIILVACAAGQGARSRDSALNGSSQIVADALRTFSGGRLKTSPGNMLPYDNLTYFTQAQINALNMVNDAQAVPESSLFAAGDVRANENVELTALQTLFVRNHNLIAAELQEEHPHWTDETLHQEARKINIAEYQDIIYTQYLPALLGRRALRAYTGYNPKVDPAIATEFSTVAFRFGHSLLSGGIERQGNEGRDVLPNDPAGAGISLATDFLDPNVLNPSGTVDPLTGHTSTDIGPILKGDADGVSQADNLMAIGDVRNLFFYRNERWNPDQLRIFRQGASVAKIIEANTSMTNVQSDVFLFKASIRGTVVSDRGGGASTAASFNEPGSRASSLAGLAGKTVELEDAGGNVLATPVTGRKGHYSFDQLTGLSATGTYTVRLAVPSGSTQSWANPTTILISRGGMNVSRVNFAVTPALAGTIPSGPRGRPPLTPSRPG